jgi:hypothetical protein
MATPREVRATLEAMTADERQAFDDTFPFDGQSRSPEGYERLFYDHPELEPAFCRLVRLSSESEKITQAAVDSAAASVVSARAARDSALWARVAGIASLLALVVSIASLFKS